MFIYYMGKFIIGLWLRFSFVDSMLHIVVLIRVLLACNVQSARLTRSQRKGFNLQIWILAPFLKRYKYLHWRTSLKFAPTQRQTIHLIQAPHSLSIYPNNTKVNGIQIQVNYSYCLGIPTTYVQVLRCVCLYESTWVISGRCNSQILV